MAKPKYEIVVIIPSVHSLLRAVGEGKLTKEQVYQNYLGYRPGEKPEEASRPPVDLLTIEEYLLRLADSFFIEQSVVPWGNSGRVSQFVYSLDKKGRNLLNPKKK